MNFIKDIFLFYLFYLENKFYYPELFKGKITIFILLDRFRVSLSNVNDMKRNHERMTKKPVSYILENGKIFSLSLEENRPEEKLESLVRLSKLLNNDIEENKPYHINIINKDDFLRVDGNIIHFGSIYIRSKNDNMDIDQYKTKLANKIHSHLGVFLECLRFLHGIDNIQISFYNDKSRFYHYNWYFSLYKLYTKFRDSCLFSLR